MIPRLFRTSFGGVRRLIAESGATSTTVKKRGNRRDTLQKRIVNSVYSKHSASDAIRVWKQQGHAIRKSELTQSILHLCSIKRAKHAIEICQYMRTHDDIEMDSGDYALYLELTGKGLGMDKAERLFENFPDDMKDQTTYTALLHIYVQYKDLDKSEALMTMMSECGFLQCPLPYNHLLSLYISMGKFEKVPEMLQELLKNTSPDIVTYNLWLSFCATQNDIETAEKVNCALKKDKIDPDWVTHSTLADLYVKSSLREKAVVTLKEMEGAISEKDRVAYLSLISLHRQLENMDEVVRIWEKMKSIFGKLNDTEYNCMISSLLKLDKSEEAEKLYAEWESVSSTRHARVPNLLLAAYINNNLFEKAETFHKRMIEKGIRPGYTTWEILTWFYLKQKQLEKTKDSFKKMVGSAESWEPDQKMIRELFELIEEHGHIESAEELLVFLRHTGYVTTEIYNYLLKTYAKAGKMPLIVTERMKQDNVQLDEKTHELIDLTRKMCVSKVPSSLLSYKKNVKGTFYH